MKPIEIFDSGRERAEQILKLHELLCNRRQSGTRQDWAKKFKRMMHWPMSEAIHRVDGKQAIVVLHGGAALKPADFREDTLGELLREALVGIVSALDRYCHDLIVSRIVAELGRSEKKINRELRQLSIPILSVKAAIRHAALRRGKGGRVRTRPMNIVRHAVQDVLYQQSFQGADDIVRGLRMVGIENLWNDCGNQMQCRPHEIIRTLNRIVDRRNEIVHEGDLKRTKRGGKLTLHAISRSQVQQDVNWVSSLVRSIESVVNRT